MSKVIGYKRAGELLDNMPDFEIARWQALMDAIELLNEKAKDKKIKWENVNIKPAAIEKFVESTCDIYCRKITSQRMLEAEIKAKKLSYLKPNIKDLI